MHSFLRDDINHLSLSSRVIRWSKTENKKKSKKNQRDKKRQNSYLHGRMCSWSKIKHGNLASCCIVFNRIITLGAAARYASPIYRTIRIAYAKNWSPKKLHLKIRNREGQALQRGKTRQKTTTQKTYTLSRFSSIKN